MQKLALRLAPGIPESGPVKREAGASTALKQWLVSSCQINIRLPKMRTKAEFGSLTFVFKPPRMFLLYLFSSVTKSFQLPSFK